MKRNKRKLFIILFIIVVIVVLLFTLLFLSKKRELFLTFNGDVISISYDDIHTYNEDVIVSCTSCFLNHKKIRHDVKIEEDGLYEIQINHQTILLEIDKSLDFDIVDYFGNKIHNYKTNTLPFLISSTSEIFVNEEVYEANLGIYEQGLYRIKSDGNAKEVSILAIEKNKEYDIFITMSTLQILYGALEMAANQNESYVWTGTSNTLDFHYLEQKDSIFISEYIGNKDALLGDLQKEVKSYIQKILLQDSNAYFNLYLDDYRYYLEYEIFSELGFDVDRYHVYYITDGTMSYENENPYAANSTYALYEDVKEFYDKVLTKIRSKKIQRELSDRVYFLPSLNRSNVTYFLQYPSYITSMDKKIQNIYDTICYDDTNLFSIYDSLDESEQIEFRKIIGFDKEEFDTLYFPSTDKRYLIITGNTPMDYGYGKESFMHMIEYVVDTYGEDYYILFKPHPRALPDEEYTAFFEDLGVRILPGSMPMEAITFIYDDLVFGGFTSSLYMTMDSEHVFFFFMNNKEEIFEPLKSMLTNEFSQVAILKPSDF